MGGPPGARLQAHSWSSVQGLSCLQHLCCYMCTCNTLGVFWGCGLQRAYIGCVTIPPAGPGFTPRVTTKCKMQQAALVQDTLWLCTRCPTPCVAFQGLQLSDPHLADPLD